MFDWLDLSGLQTSIRNAPQDDFWIWSSVLALASMAAGYGIFHFLHRARIIENTPTSKIRSAVQGYVELIGTGEWLDAKPNIAPLTRQSCTWYSYRIEKKEVTYSSKGGTRTRWRTVESGDSKAFFILEDDTGQCVINPQGAEVYPSAEDVWYGGSHYPESGPDVRGSFFSGGSYRYTEKRMHAGDPLYALGKFITVDNNHPAKLQAELRDLLVKWKEDQASLLQRFDTNSDGKIDMQEWTAARDVAQQEVLKQRLQRAVEPVTHMLIRTDSRRQPFILSVEAQLKMVKRFRIYASLCSILFILGGPFYIWSLFVRLS